MRRHTDDLRTDEPNAVDVVAVLVDTLKRIPDDLLADLGIKKTADGKPSSESMRAMSALLGIFRMASEWDDEPGQWKTFVPHRSGKTQSVFGIQCVVFSGKGIDRSEHLFQFTAHLSQPFNSTASVFGLPARGGRVIG